MDDSRTADDGALRYACPHCGHEEVDEYEVIEAGRPVDARCGQCGRLFVLLLTECDLCGIEHVAVGRTRAGLEDSSAPACPRVGKPCVHHEHDELEELAF